MRTRRFAIAVMVSWVLIAVPAAADTVTQQPLPWASPPFTNFTRFATTDPAGDVFILATGPSSSYVAAFNPQSDTPLASVGSGSGIVQVTPPSGASTEGIFIQGSSVFLFGGQPQGAFVQGFSLTNGSTSGPTTFTKPAGTSFTATGGATSAGTGGATNFLLIGTDTISHNKLLVTGAVTNGAPGPSTLCPSAFNTLTGAPTLAPSTIAANQAGQMLVGGVQISGLSQLPAVAAANSGCTSLTTTPLEQPNGQTSDGFVDALAALSTGNFVAASDLSAGTGGAMLVNSLQPTGAAALGSSPFESPAFASVSVTSVFPYNTGFAVVGSQTTAGQPTAGSVWAFNRALAPFETTFLDSNHAEVVPRVAIPVSSGAAILGEGSSLSGNTLDIWKVATTTQPPPCTPVLTVTKRLRLVHEWQHGRQIVLFPLDLGTIGDAVRGALLQYNIEVSNTGDCDADNVEISDALPPGFTYSYKISYVSVTGPDGKPTAGQGAVPPHMLSGGALLVTVPVLKPRQHATVLIGGTLTAPGTQHNVANARAEGGGPAISNETSLTVLTSAKVVKETVNLNAARGTLAPPKQTDTHKVDQVSQVEVALEQDGRHGSCQWLNGKGRMGTVRSGCDVIQWLRATGTTSWSYHFKKRLKPGRYQLFVRPVTKRGAAPSTFSTSLHNLFELQLM